MYFAMPLMRLVSWRVDGPVGVELRFRNALDGRSNTGDVGDRGGGCHRHRRRHVWGFGATEDWYARELGGREGQQTGGSPRRVGRRHVPCGEGASGPGFLVGVAGADRFRFLAALEANGVELGVNGGVTRLGDGRVHAPNRGSATY